MNEKSERSGSHPHVNSLAARTPAVIQVAALYAAYPMAFVSAAWITVGRALFGAAGDLVPIFAISFGPALALILCLAARWAFAGARRAVAAAEHPPRLPLGCGDCAVCLLGAGVFIRHVYSGLPRRDAGFRNGCACGRRVRGICGRVR